MRDLYARFVLWLIGPALERHAQISDDRLQPLKDRLDALAFSVSENRRLIQLEEDARKSSGCDEAVSRADADAVVDGPRWNARDLKVAGAITIGTPTAFVETLSESHVTREQADAAIERGLRAIRSACAGSAEASPSQRSDTN